MKKEFYSWHLSCSKLSLIKIPRRKRLINFYREHSISSTVPMKAIENVLYMNVLRRKSLPPCSKIDPTEGAWAIKRQETIASFNDRWSSVCSKVLFTIICQFLPRTLKRDDECLWKGFSMWLVLWSRKAIKLFIASVLPWHLVASTIIWRCLDNREHNNGDVKVLLSLILFSRSLCHAFNLLQNRPLYRSKPVGEWKGKLLSEVDFLSDKTLCALGLFRVRFVTALDLGSNLDKRMRTIKEKERWKRGNHGAQNQMPTNWSPKYNRGKSFLLPVNQLCIMLIISSHTLMLMEWTQIVTWGFKILLVPTLTCRIAKNCKPTI